MTHDQAVKESYRRFPDTKRPSEHPLGESDQYNGSLRYAFIEGVRFAIESAAPAVAILGEERT